MKVAKLADLKKAIGPIVNRENGQDFPCEIILDRGMEFPKYRITIEEFEDDVYIDSKGNKWAKVK